MAVTSAAGSIGTPSERVAGRASPLRVMRVIWLREVLVYSRDRARMVSALTMPVLMMLIFGAGLGNTIGSLAEGLNYRQFIFPGMMAMTVLTTSVFSGISIIWDRQFGFLREILVAPVSRTAIAAGKLLGGATIAVFQGCVMFVFAPVLGVTLSLEVMIKLLLVMSLMAMTMTSLGIALASRLKSVESFQMVSQMTIMPAMFLSGIFFPINNVPAWLEVLTKINPVTYAVAPIRSIGLSGHLPAGASAEVALVVNPQLFGHVLSTAESLTVLAVFGVVMLLFAVRSFQRGE